MLMTPFGVAYIFKQLGVMLNEFSKEPSTIDFFEIGSYSSAIGLLFLAELTNLKESFLFLTSGDNYFLLVELFYTVTSYSLASSLMIVKFCCQSKMSS
jgi:hypothetical protein